MNYKLQATDPLTNLVHSKGIHYWHELVLYIQHLPYGRNVNREDLSLVITEQKGTCSSKHALLKAIADSNNIQHVQLVISMYTMNKSNTPKIGNTLLDAGLDYLPEAHCYLKINNQRLDITTQASNMVVLESDILLELEVEPAQVNNFKIDFHKNYLQQWISQNKINLSFEQAWIIRELCIQQLEK